MECQSLSEGVWLLTTLSYNELIQNSEPRKFFMKHITKFKGNIQENSVPYTLKKNGRSDERARLVRIGIWQRRDIYCGIALSFARCIVCSLSGCPRDNFSPNAFSTLGLKGVLLHG
jgi:hypothetical protein